VSNKARWIIAAAIIAAILLLMPWPRRISYVEEAMEYSLEDEALAIPHQVEIEGTYLRRIIGRDSFQGTFYVSGVEGLEYRENNAGFSFEPGRLYSPAFMDEYGQPHGAGISLLLFDAHFDRLAIQLSPAQEGATGFIVPEARSREEAAAQYAGLMEQARP